MLYLLFIINFKVQKIQQLQYHNDQSINQPLTITNDIILFEFDTIYNVNAKFNVKNNTVIENFLKELIREGFLCLNIN